MATRAIDPGARDPARDPWAQRHPDRAREETALRRQRREIRKEFGKVTYGTPETRFHASRVVQGCLARLYLAGDLSIEQLSASQEIATVYNRIASGVTIGTMSMETRVDQSGRGDGVFFEQLGAVRREVAYGRWRAALPNPFPVLEMIVEDLGISAAAKRWRMRNTGAKAMLCHALDLWPAMVEQACREVREADLLAAQAGIL